VIGVRVRGAARPSIAIPHDVGGTRLAPRHGMRAHLFLFAAALAAAAACNNHKGDGDRAAKPVAADNTGRNAEDHGSATPTADQAVTAPGDLDLTQAIRQAIVGDSTLSTDAHNVKIIVRDGVVTLRGPVASEAERAAVGGIAARAAGPHKIVDELEVTK
jgi:hyperosmotically inducible periplasmic protein